MSVLDVHVTLEALRKALVVLEKREMQRSMVSKLRKDAENLKKSCGSIWDSIGDADDEEDGIRLDTVSRVTHSRRSLLSSSLTRESSHRSSSRKPRGHSKITPALLEDNVGGGRTLAGSLGSTVAAWLPAVFVGTQSMYSVVVPVGMKTVIPHYTLQGGTLVVDHYSLYTSSSTLMGWAPIPHVVVSAVSIPIFASIFALSHSIDAIHGYVNNHCSLAAAMKTVAVGGLAGIGFGLAYYALVSSLGIASSPMVSLGLCSLWLLGCYVKRKPGESFADLVIAGSANVGAVTALILSGGSSWVSLGAALATSVVGGKLYQWGNDLWTNRLEQSMIKSAREILKLDENATTDEINFAYRRMARVCHPDKSGDREAFELIHLSKEILLKEKAEKQLEKIETRSSWWSVFDITSSVIPSEKSPQPTAPVTDKYLLSPD